MNLLRRNIIWILILIIIIIVPILLIDLPKNIKKNEQKDIALKYFFNKYKDIDKDQVIVKDTRYAYHEKDDICINGCDNINITYIVYKDVDYEIKYNFEKGFWTDNFEQKQLEEDYKKFFENKFPGLIVYDCKFEFVVDRSNIKYNGNIEDYINKADLSYFWPKFIYVVSIDNALKIKNETADGLIKYLSKNHQSYDISYQSDSSSWIGETNSYYYYHIFPGYKSLYDGINKEYIKLD